MYTSHVRMNPPNLHALLMKNLGPGGTMWGFSSGSTGETRLSGRPQLNGRRSFRKVSVTVPER